MLRKKRLILRLYLLCLIILGVSAQGMANLAIRLQEVA